MKRSFPIDYFLTRAADDSRLLPSHLSLFMAVFYFCPAEDLKGRFRVCRRKLMRYSRIHSVSTYHKCMRELVAYGYITYQPSYDPFRASLVSFVHVHHE